MKSMKRFIVTLGLVSVTVSPTSANAWTGNIFQSPSGNILCKFRWVGAGTLACGSFASQKVISMASHGRPLQGIRIGWAAGDTYYKLGYGQIWNQGKPISCRSLSSGMRCQNSDAWFFLVTADRVYVGRYGQLLYWL